MANLSPAKLRERVFRAAEALLNRSGNVGPLELFQEMGLLQPVHFEAWRNGIVRNSAKRRTWSCSRR